MQKNLHTQFKNIEGRLDNLLDRRVAAPAASTTQTDLELTHLPIRMSGEMARYKLGQDCKRNNSDKLLPIRFMRCSHSLPMVQHVDVYPRGVCFLVRRLSHNRCITLDIFETLAWQHPCFLCSCVFRSNGVRMVICPRDIHSRAFARA